MTKKNMQNYPVGKELAHLQGQFLGQSQFYNGEARILKKVGTLKGDYWIKHMILFNCVPFQNGNFS